MAITKPRLPKSKNEARKAVDILRREEIKGIPFKKFWEEGFLLEVNGNGRIVTILDPQENILCREKKTATAAIE